MREAQPHLGLAAQAGVCREEARPPQGTKPETVGGRSPKVERVREGCMGVRSTSGWSWVFQKQRGQS